jgi:hypothetical protein
LAALPYDRCHHQPREVAKAKLLRIGGRVGQESPAVNQVAAELHDREGPRCRRFWSRSRFAVTPPEWGSWRFGYDTERTGTGLRAEGNQSLDAGLGSRVGTHRGNVFLIAPRTE